MARTPARTPARTGARQRGREPMFRSYPLYSAITPPGSAGESRSTATAAEARDDAPRTSSGAVSGEAAPAAPARAVLAPAAGDLAWPRYAELHDLAATLLAQWTSLLESPQELPPLAHVP